VNCDSVSTHTALSVKLFFWWKTSSSVGTFIVVTWYGPVWLLHVPERKSPCERFVILNSLKTFRAIWWRHWKDFEEMISSSVSRHENDVRMCMKSAKASALKVNTLTIWYMLVKYSRNYIQMLESEVTHGMYCIWHGIDVCVCRGVNGVIQKMYLSSQTLPASQNHCGTVICILIRISSSGNAFLNASWCADRFKVKIIPSSLCSLHLS